MKRLTAVLTAALALLALAAAPASAAFGLKNLDVTFTAEDGSPSMQAGSHPFAWTTKLDVNTVGEVPTGLPDGALKDLVVEAPPGLVADLTAVPQCSAADFATVGSDALPKCADAAAIGTVEAKAVKGGDPGAIYNLQPSPGKLAKFGFHVLSVGVAIEIGLRADGEPKAFAVIPNIPQAELLYGSVATIWGSPYDPAHDDERGRCAVYPGSCPVANKEEAFLTLPTRCTGPLETIFKADSWQNPGSFIEGKAMTHDNSQPVGTAGCGEVAFGAEISSALTATTAETGAGLDFDLDVEDEGLSNPEGIAKSQIKKAVVTLPNGVTINPSVGEGLGVCTPSDLARETVTSAPGVGCPNASKLGTLHVESPLVDEAVEGSIFLAQQDDPATATPGAENPFDTLIALYFVLKNPNLGVLVKEPVKVEPDPKSGQLVVTLDDNIQVPFGHFNAHLRTGARAALITPSACGTYTTEAKLTPWANPSTSLTTTASFEITRGVNAGPCPPGGVPPFHPGFEAGSINNNAGSFSPFNMRLIRGDGEQDMTKFSSILPPGELGSLSGVDKCPDSAIDVAKSKTGRQEIASPSCPANSLIGHTLAGAGVGNALTYVKGQVYLGGPYHGDPLSVISVTPAVAGPFDAGTVVVRLALTLNPKTAEVEVDGAASDPIPHILKGIVLKVRDLRVYVDRPNFTLNPTSCDESSAKGTIFGSNLDIFSPADDVPFGLSTRYQAANCLNLGFKPKLALQLKGGTKRGGHPGLLATYRTRSGDANLNDLVVRLPRSAFLDQAHIRTICTRVQFAAKSCPSGAQYGFIKAWTPLLDDPLEGPVWLRSSNHKLPDLVFDLHGLVDIEVATRIDSAKGGIRASLEKLPDAPLSKVLLRMQGGKKGLIINSRSLCGTTSKANVEFGAQNGKESSLKPVMQPDCGKGRKGKRAGH